MAVILATNLRTQAEDGSPKVIPWGTPLEALSESDREYAVANKLLVHVLDPIPTLEEEIALTGPSFQSQETDDEDLVAIEEETTEAE